MRTRENQAGDRRAQSQRAPPLTSMLQDLKRFLSPRQYFPPMVGLEPDKQKQKHIWV